MHLPRGKPAHALYAAQAVHSVGASRSDVQQSDRVALRAQAVRGMQPHPRHGSVVAGKGTVLHRQHQHPQRRVVQPRRTDQMAFRPFREADVLRLQCEGRVRIPHVHLQGRDCRIVIQHDIHLRRGGAGLLVALQVEGVGLVALGREVDALQVIARIVGVEQHLGAVVPFGNSGVAYVQRVATVVAHRQRQVVGHLPPRLGEHRAVYHQRRIARVAHQQGGRSRLGDGRVSQVHAAVAAQVGAVDAHRAGIHGRQHVAPRAVAQGGIQQAQRVAAVAVQAQLEAGHHAVGAVHRRCREAGQQQGQRVPLQACRGDVVRGARGIHCKAAFHVGQRLRQLDGGLQAHDAVHVVHPQLHGDRAVGVAAHTQRPQLVHRVGVGHDAHHAVAHLRVAMQGGAHGGGAGPHRAVSKRHRLLPSRRQCRRQRAAQRRVAEGGSPQRQCLVADVLHRQAAGVAAPYRHVAVVHRRRCHLQLRCQHGDGAARGADRQRGAVGCRE